MASNRSNRTPRLALLLIGGLGLSLIAACSSGAGHRAAPSGRLATGQPSQSAAVSPSPSNTGAAHKSKKAAKKSANRGQNPVGGNTGRCPAYPTPDCTGVPTGTHLTELASNDGSGGYKITQSGTVLDGVHFAGDMVVAVNGVTIKNSQIDGSVRNEVGDAHYFSFTIIDSVVGPAHGCQSNDAIGRAKYTAIGDLVRGHSHGFMDSGDNIVIRDSYVRNCSNGNDHSDGIQAYVPGKNLILDHNTLDQRGIADFTAPVYLSDSAGHTIANVTVTNNLLMGGTYSIQLKNAAGTLVVQNNRMVDNTWSYGPVESECSVINWSGNTLVTIDSAYRVTSTVGPLPCHT